MSAEDYFDFGTAFDQEWDGYGDYPHYKGKHHSKTYYPPKAPPFSRVCKECGKGGLDWKITKDGWRLGTKAGELHKCHHEIKLFGPKPPVSFRKSTP